MVCEKFHKVGLRGLTAATLFAAAVSSAVAVQSDLPPDPFASEGGNMDVRVPDSVQQSDIDQQLEGQIPTGLTFTDDHGEEVTLAKYFAGEKPVILTLNYFRCPQLCDLTLNGLVDGLEQLKWTIGDEFDIVTVSFNPDETHELGALKKRSYIASYGKDEAVAVSGWHFLTGDQKNIDTLTKAVGMNYKRVERSDGGIEYAHPPIVVFATPDGVISSYMSDVLFQPRDLRLALVDASEGSIGAPIETFLLFTCFQYDPVEGSFVPNAWKIMRSAGLLTIFAMALGGWLLYRRSPKRNTVETMNTGELAGVGA